MKVTKTNNTTEPEKYVYSGYGVSFDHIGQFTHSDGTQARNLIIFGADLSNSIHATNKIQRILVLGHGLIQKIKTQQFMQKKCIYLIFVQKIKHFV